MARFGLKLDGAPEFGRLLAAVASPNGKAFGALAVGAAALAASAFLVIRGDIDRSARAAATLLLQETKELKAEATALEAQRKTEKTTSLTSVPAFIDRIGVLADRRRAVVGAVQPSRRDDTLFEIVLHAPYRALIGFVSDLEGLDVQVASFKLKRKALGPGKPMLEATVAIRPRNEAQSLSIPRLDDVRAAISAEAARNPFQALVAAAEAGGADRLDLSEAYRLTGIATISPSGERIATIDLLDYVTGDVLDGREVVAVEADRVLLDPLDPESSDKYVIRMRLPGEGARSLPGQKTFPPVSAPGRRP